MMRILIPLIFLSELLQSQIAQAFVQPQTNYQSKATLYSNQNIPKTATKSSVKSNNNQVTTNQSSAINSNATPDMVSYAKGFQTVFQELPYASNKPTQSSGSLPSDLIGTYFRSGPAMFSAGSLPPPKKSIVQPKQPPVPDGVDMNRMVKHPFDADGAMLALTFTGDGTASTRFRYIRTNAFTNERKKGLRLYNSLDSTRLNDGNAIPSYSLANDFPIPMYKHHLMPGLNKLRKNTSNTRALYFAKKLISLWDGGLPYKLDALALSTEGRSQLGGVLLEATAFGSKAVLDPIKNFMLFYSIKQDIASSILTVYEFNSKFRLHDKSEYKLPGFALLSDFGSTSSFSIFVQPPITTNKMQFLLSKDPSKSLKMESSQSSTLHLIPRSTNKSGMKSITIPFDGEAESELQICNSYESNGGKQGGKVIILDVIRSQGNNQISKPKVNEWPWFSTINDYQSSSSKKSLWRYTIDLSTNSVSKVCLSDLQTSFAVINPAFSCQKHRYIYANIGSMGNQVAPPQGIAKFDVESNTMTSWLPKEYEFCGEPMFASRNKNNDEANGSTSTIGLEDDGYILSILYNGKDHASELIVLDAQNIEQGPISRVPLGIAVPHGLHGCFSNASEANWSSDEIERRSKLADKMESRGNMWNEVKSDFSGLGLRLDDFEEYFGDIL